MADFTITGTGVSNWITSRGRTVAGPYTSHQNAVAALRGVEARRRPVTLRRCLCCTETFKSTGPGNRLCPICRRDA